MPELPEVETIARALKPDLVGRTILSADLRWARTLAIPSFNQFKKQIISQEILDVSRRAKYLVIRLKNYELLIHLRMSGDLIIRAGKIKPEKHDRLLLYLSDHNYLVDSRVSGAIVRLAPFGAFMRLEPGFDGLIHISNLGAGRRINHPKEVVEAGQTVEAYVLSVDKENRKLSLSLQPKPKPITAPSKPLNGLPTNSGRTWLTAYPPVVQSMRNRMRMAQSGIMAALF